MKLKDLLSKVSKNKANGQLTTCIRKNELRKVGMNEKDLLNMNISTKLNELFNE